MLVKLQCHFRAGRNEVYSGSAGNLHLIRGGRFAPARLYVDLSGLAVGVATEQLDALDRDSGRPHVGGSFAFQIPAAEAGDLRPVGFLPFLVGAGNGLSQICRQAVIGAGVSLQCLDERDMDHQCRKLPIGLARKIQADHSQR